MREILFRGKRVDNGEWVEGYYLCQKNNYIGTRHYIYVFGDKEYNEYCDEDSRYEVDSATIGQYTGLQDKNGNKIFEGDIVQVQRTKHIVPAIHKIEYRNTSFMWGVHIVGEFMYPELFEIIGNIHDNPELLEVK